MQPPMKCVYFYVLALTLAFPRDVRHVCPVVESVTSWGARCTRRVRVVPDVPLTLNKRKRARELLSQHIFLVTIPSSIPPFTCSSLQCCVHSSIHPSFHLSLHSPVRLSLHLHAQAPVHLTLHPMTIHLFIYSSIPP